MFSPDQFPVQNPQDYIQFLAKLGGGSIHLDWQATLAAADRARSLLRDEGISEPDGVRLGASKAEIAEAMALGTVIADYETRKPSFQDDPRTQRIDFPYLGVRHIYDNTRPDSKRSLDQITWVGFTQREVAEYFRQHPGSQGYMQEGRSDEDSYVTKIDTYYNPSYGDIEPAIPDAQTLQNLLAETGFTQDPVIAAFVTTDLQTIATGHLDLRKRMLAGDKRLAKAYCNVNRRERLQRQLSESSKAFHEPVVAKITSSLQGQISDAITAQDRVDLYETIGKVAELFRLPHDSYWDVQRLIVQFMSCGWVLNRLKQFGIQKHTGVTSKDEALAWVRQTDDNIADLQRRLSAAINAERQEYARGDALYYPAPKHP